MSGTTSLGQPSGNVALERAKLQLLVGFRRTSSIVMILALALIGFVLLREFGFLGEPPVSTTGTMPDAGSRALPVLGLSVAVLGIWGWLRAQTRRLRIELLLADIDGLAERPSREASLAG